MSRLHLKNIRPGVVISIGPEITVTVAIDKGGDKYLQIEAPRELEITRRNPNVLTASADSLCPRCKAAVAPGSERCRACGKALEARHDTH